MEFSKLGAETFQQADLLLAEFRAELGGGLLQSQYGSCLVNGLGRDHTPRTSPEGTCTPLSDRSWATRSAPLVG